MIHQRALSQDGSIKYVLALPDKNLVEAIYFQDKEKDHLCISSMVGCPEKCSFCASGIGGLKRNMQSVEIVSQVRTILNDLSEISSTYSELKWLVYQGMGEPLLNLKNVIESIEILRSEINSLEGVSISTVGKISGLKKLLDVHHLIDNLYLSLHATSDAQRKVIIPLASSNPMTTLLKLMKEFAILKNRKPIISYLLLKDFNDSKEDFKKLTSLIDKDYFRIQILLYNEIQGLPYERPSESKAHELQDYLISEGFDSYIVISKGRDIDGGCGQLRLNALN